MASNNPIPVYRGIWDALTLMYRTEGFVSLYRGAVVNLAAGSISQSIFFYMYADGKKRYNFDADRPDGLQTVFIGMRAGLVCNVITTPLWVIKTRLALHREANL